MIFIIRLTICFVPFCYLHYSQALPSFFSDPEVGYGASASSIPNFAAQQELSQSFIYKQPDTTQPWPDQYPFAISALDGESGQEAFELSKACGRGAGAKFNKKDLLCTPDTLQPPTQEAGQRPAGNTETPNNPLGPPPPDEHPGKPSNDHQPEAETRWGATQSWMQRMEATEDNDSDMCGKGQFAICDSGNPYFRIHQVGTIYYALLQAAWFNPLNPCLSPRWIWCCKVFYQTDGGIFMGTDSHRAEFC